MKEKPTKPSTPYVGPGHIFPQDVKKPQPNPDNQRPEIYY